MIASAAFRLSYRRARSAKAFRRQSVERALAEHGNPPPHSRFGIRQADGALCRESSSWNRSVSAAQRNPRSSEDRDQVFAARASTKVARCRPGSSLHRLGQQTIGFGGLFCRASSNSRVPEASAAVIGEINELTQFDFTRFFRLDAFRLAILRAIYDRHRARNSRTVSSSLPLSSLRAIKSPLQQRASLAQGCSLTQRACAGNDARHVDQSRNSSEARPEGVKRQLFRRRLLRLPAVFVFFGAAHVGSYRFRHHDSHCRFKLSRRDSASDSPLSSITCGFPPLRLDFLACSLGLDESR